MEKETKRRIGLAMIDIGSSLKPVGMAAAVTSGICAVGCTVAGDRSTARTSLFIGAAGVLAKGIGTIFTVIGDKIVNSTYEE